MKRRTEVQKIVLRQAIKDLRKVQEDLRNAGENLLEQQLGNLRMKLEMELQRQDTTVYYQNL